MLHNILPTLAISETFINFVLMKHYRDIYVGCTFYEVAANGYKSKAVAGDHSSAQEARTDEREISYLKEMLKAREREIADKETIIAEKERLIQVLMKRLEIMS